MKCNQFGKMLAFLLAVSMCLMSTPAFSLAIDTYVESDFENELENPTHITESVTEEKIPFEIIDDHDFDISKISAIIFKEYSHETFNVDFFSGYIPEGIEIETIELFNDYQKNDDNYNAILIIEVKDSTGERIINLAQSIYNHPKVMKVELHYAFESCISEPCDPVYVLEKNAYEQINAIAAWTSVDNLQEVKVAVIDTGVKKHVDLESNVERDLEYDYENGEKDTSNSESDHGTIVSGIIGAVWNDAFIAGVNNCVKIVPFQIKYPTQIRDALDICDENGIEIVNLSVSYPEKSGTVKSAIDNFDGVIVCAAGNKYNNLDTYESYPSKYDCNNIISVGACNQNFTGKADFSNYSSTFVDIMGPGENIYSTVGVDSGGYFNGTSVSAPFVTGAASLLKSACPEATSEQIIYALEHGCDTSKAWATQYSKYGILDISKSLDILSYVSTHGNAGISDKEYCILPKANSFKALERYESNTLANYLSDEASQKFEININYVNPCNYYYTIKNVKFGSYLQSGNNGALEYISVGNTSSIPLAARWMVKTSGEVYHIYNLKSNLYLTCDLESTNPTQQVTLKSKNNSSSQLFKLFLPQEKQEISDGLYIISSKTGGNVSACSSGSTYALNGANDIFEIENHDGYCYIKEFYGNKALGISGDGNGNLTLCSFTESTDDNNQKWVINDCYDGSVYITPYSSKSVIAVENGNSEANALLTIESPTGSDNQRFCLEELNQNHFIYFYNVKFTFRTNTYFNLANGDRTFGIELSDGTTYPMSESSEHVLSLDIGDYGIITIKDPDTGKALESDVDGNISFGDFDGSDGQRWVIQRDELTYYITNAYSGKELVYIENDDGIQVTSAFYDIVESSDLYHRLSIMNYQFIQENINYLIIPKSAPNKALTYIGTDGISCAFRETDFSDFQKIYFSLNTSTQTYGLYKIRYNQENETSTVKTFMNNVRINKTDDGYYVFSRGYQTYTYDNGALTQINGVEEYGDNHKFMIVPFTDVVDNGTYQILSGDKALSVSDMSDEIVKETPSVNDKSQKFYCFYYNGGYRFINLQTGKTIGMSDTIDTVVQKVTDLSDMSQQWQIVNAERDDDGYTVRLVSFRTGEYLTDNDSLLNTAYYKNSEDRQFTLKRISGHETTAYGEIVSVTDDNRDISISDGNILLSSISENGRTTLSFVKDVNGLWTVSERISGKVLDCAEETVAFNTANNSLSQKWIVNCVEGTRVSIVNAYNGLSLSNNSNSLTANTYSGQASQLFDVYMKGDVNGDNLINVGDMILMKHYISSTAQLSAGRVYTADLNLDGAVGAADISIIQKYLSSNGPIISEPEENTLESVDATSQSLTVNETASSDVAENLILQMVIEMSDDEFVEYMFGDVSVDTLGTAIFD